MSMKKWFLFCLFAAALLLACNLPRAATPTASYDVSTMVAATLTAFQPRTDEPTPGGEPVPTPTPTEVLPVGDLPGSAVPISQPKGQVTILLMGSDQRPHTGGFRTDTMVLLVLKPDGSASLVSFPRDLWVNLPGKFMQRLNTAMEFGDFELVQSTFQYNFGFAPQSYVLTNFSGFKSIVDSLGGVDVQVGRTLVDGRDGYPNGYRLDPGTVHMDGDTALWYVRSRKTTSDLDRLRRSQEVIAAIGLKLFSLNGLTRVPDFYQSFRGAVVTDLTLTDSTSLLPLLRAVNADKVQRYAISSDQVDPWMTGGGASVLLPRPQAIHDLLVEALGG
jgi:polyisoprenyl-teichoic acid--peptidoglycan teichoic acid transferase